LSVLGKRNLRRVSLSMAAASLGVLLVGTPAQSAALTTCTDSQVVPQIAELLVSQGAPGYARYARGKDTIVRAYLTAPTACTLSNKQSITPISATLDVTTPDGLQTQLTNSVALSGKVTATTAQVVSASDPYFFVPGSGSSSTNSYFAPLSTTNSFNMTFTLKVTYSRNGSSTYNQTAATDPNATKTVTVDQKTNALRVLVVPMGDPTSTTTQWSSAADSTFQNIMSNVARAYPVEPGATPSLTATTGIRYLMSTTLLDVKSLGLYTSGKFCGTAGNWSTSQVTSGALAGHTLKGDLLQRLSDWNDPLKRNPPADLVLGVIDGNIASKSSDGTGCDDGRAATPTAGSSGQVAWVRIDTGSYPSAVQMELLHPLGISRTISFHSSNVEADLAEQDHGYNVLQRKVISTVTGALGTDDHSIMNYNTSTIPYTKDNTLLEPSDWRDALCDLGGIDSATPVPFANCALGSALGTAQGAASGHVFYQASGILTSGGGVRVTMAAANQSGRVDANGVPIQTGIACKTVDPYDSPTNPRPLCSTPGKDSSVHLLLYNSAGAVLKDVGLAVLSDEGHGASDDVNSNPNGFGALVEMDPNMTNAALKLNGTTLVPLGNSADPAPDVTSTSTGEPTTVLRSFTPYSAEGEINTSLCCNGRSVAFDGTNLYITVASSSGGSENQYIYKVSPTDGKILSSLKTGTTIGALAYNAMTGHLYGGNYTGTGEVYEIDPSSVNPDTGLVSRSTLFTFSDPNCNNFIDGLESNDREAPLTRFAMSGDECQTVFGKDVNGATLQSFSTTDENSGITKDGSGGLWLALLFSPGHLNGTVLTRTDQSGNVLDKIVLDGYQAEDLAYDSVTFAPKCAVWMNQATGGSPTVQAVQVPCGASNPQQADVTTTNAKFVSLFFTCRNLSDTNDDRPIFPLANGLRPDGSGQVIAAYSSQLFCGGSGESPKIISEASNGWASTGLSDQQAVAPVSAPARVPIVNIASPLNGAAYRRGQFVHYEGSATDAQDNAITGGSLKWYDGTTQIGTGQSFDLRLTSTAALGNHTIKLEATDSQGNVRSATVTISVAPAVCASTANCP
jgi:hypothetical protein